MNTTDRLRQGDRLRVVSNPETRKYGVRCANTWDAHDRALWPGEIGAVVREPYIAHNGEPMAAWAVEFSRGRRVSLTVPEGCDYATAREACFLLDSTAEPFRRVRAGAQRPGQEAP